MVLIDLNFVSYTLNVTPNQQLFFLHFLLLLLIFTPNDRFSDSQVEKKAFKHIHSYYPRNTSVIAAAFLFIKYM